MAGEWLKMELSTPDKPEIKRMARILSIDKDAVFGKLFRVWAWFDQNSVDGHVDGVVAADIDDIALQVGFANAMAEVHWITFDLSAQWVTLPKFDRHNGQTAKTRALKTERQAKWRKNVNKVVDGEASTDASTREEKRREDIKTNTNILSSPATPKNDPIPYEEIVKLYHEILPTCPKVSLLTNKRKGQIGARWRSGVLPDLETWKKYFIFISKSRFLMGLIDPPENKKRFVANLEWITNETNFAKIWEKKYHEEI